MNLSDNLPVAEYLAVWDRVLGKLAPAVLHDNQFNRMTVVKYINEHSAGEWSNTTIYAAINAKRMDLEWKVQPAANLRDRGRKNLDGSVNVNVDEDDYVDLGGTDNTDRDKKEIAEARQEISSIVRSFCCYHRGRIDHGATDHYKAQLDELVALNKELDPRQLLPVVQEAAANMNKEHERKYYGSKL